MDDGENNANGPAYPPEKQEEEDEVMMDFVSGK